MESIDLAAQGVSTKLPTSGIAAVYIESFPSSPLSELPGCWWQTFLQRLDLFHELLVLHLGSLRLAVSGRLSLLSATAN